MYVLINAAREQAGHDWAAKFALHFFMFYDAGEAAKAAGDRDHKDFWDYCYSGYPTFKRGTERRHFRGAKGFDAMKQMRLRGDPEDIWADMWSETYPGLLKNIELKFKGCQIGPYFAWKAMDLLDRGLGQSVDLELKEAVQHMPDEPRKCAAKVWPDMSLERVLNIVTYNIADLPAPGANTRNCHYAEAETVLCMIKGYFLTKTHDIGDDVDEKHSQLREFPELRELLPKQQNWTSYVKAVDSPTISA